MNKPMNEKEDCITMMTDSGESVDFYVLEEPGSMEKTTFW